MFTLYFFIVLLLTERDFWKITLFYWFIISILHFNLLCGYPSDVYALTVLHECVNACTRVLPQVCAWLQIKTPVDLQGSIPLRNLLYVSGVMSCHWPDSLTQYQHGYFACVKTDYVHYVPHACVCVCVCTWIVLYSIVSCASIGPVHPNRLLSAWPLCWLLTRAHWKYANNYPYCTYSGKNERTLSPTQAHTHTCLSNHKAKVI